MHLGVIALVGLDVGPQRATTLLLLLVCKVMLLRLLLLLLLLLIMMLHLIIVDVVVFVALVFNLALDRSWHVVAGFLTTGAAAVRLLHIVLCDDKRLFTAALAPGARSIPQYEH